MTSQNNPDKLHPVHSSLEKHSEHLLEKQVPRQQLPLANKQLSFASKFGSVSKCGIAHKQ